MTQETLRRERTPIAEPWIVARVGDVARPRRTLSIQRDLAHIPGETGLVVGIKTIYGMFARGNASFLAKRAAHGEVARTQFGADPVVLFFDPDAVGTMLKNDDGLWSTALGWRSILNGIDPTSDSLDIVNGLDFQLHRDARKLMQPAFSKSAIQSYVSLALEEFEKALPSLRGTVPFKAAVRRVFAGVAGRIFMGVDDPKDIAMLDLAMDRFWGAAMTAIKNPLWSRAWRLGQRGYRALFDLLRGLVEERRRGPERSDLFTRLCQLPKDTDWIDDDTLVRLFIGIMIAAFDTTSNAVTSMAYLLARHPEWQERLRAECARVSSHEELEDVGLVWKETLRLFPVAPDVPRRALAATELGGYRIPAGTMALPMIGPLMQHPAWWKEPSRFDPERFTDARAEHKKHRSIYLPFGAGAHACIGAQLSEMEAKVFFRLLLSKRRWTLADKAPAAHQYTPLGTVKGLVRLRFEEC